MTNVETVAMLWHHVMRPSPNRSRWIVVVAASAMIHCEPLDETRPPMTAEPATPAASTSAPLGQSTDTSAPGAGENANMYASGEVAIGTETDGYSDDDPAALADFRSTLDSRGSWQTDGTYGTVWVPSPAVVGADFHPYVTAGHWTYENDWVWVSDYDWGWAPFHYGRWVWIEGRGWSWIPGREYRGAWVTWGVDDGYGYVGWAPMPPTFVWFGGSAVGLGFYAGPRWVFCRHDDVFSPAVGARIIAGPAAAQIASRVRPYVPATPSVATAGPPPQKLGFQSAQIPRATPANAAGVVRAQQFARPASAQLLGARPPTPIVARAPAARAPIAGATPSRVQSASVFRPPVATPRAAPPMQSVPMPRAMPSPSFHGGGHRR